MSQPNGSQLSSVLLSNKSDDGSLPREIASAANLVSSTDLWLHHRRDLEESGLSVGTIQKAGFYSALSHELSDLLGFSVQSNGLVIPYPVNDKSEYVRVKLDQSGEDGKRYRSPAGARNRLYIPALLDLDTLTNKHIVLYVT
jgi:hypothetical protein